MGDLDKATLLTNAVKFLQDPHVKGTPLDKQTEFLERKGLTRDDIQKALQIARATTDEASSDIKDARSSVPPPLPLVPPKQLDLIKNDTRFRWGKFALALVLIGSAGVALSQSIFAVLCCGPLTLIFAEFIG